MINNNDKHFFHVIWLDNGRAQEENVVRKVRLDSQVHLVLRVERAPLEMMDLKEIL